MRTEAERQKLEKQYWGHLDNTKKAQTLTNLNIDTIITEKPNRCKAKQPTLLHPREKHWTT